MAVQAAYLAVYILVTLLWVVTGWAPIQFLASPFTIIGFCVGNLAFLVAMASPRMPLRLVLPLVLWHGYNAIGAMPFSVLVLIRRVHSLWLVLGAAVVLAVFVMAVRSLPHRRGWWITSESLRSRRRFAPLRTAGLLFLSLVVAPVGVGAYGVACTWWIIDYATGSYAGITPEGFVVRARTFTRGDTEVVLQGMMHIGEKRAYDDLYSSFGERENTLVLTEGVSDEQNLIGLTSGYGRVAARMGLEQQAPIVEKGFTVRNADVDVSEFRESSIELLRHSFSIWQADNPAVAYAEMSMNYAGADPAELYPPLYADIVTLRNEVILEHIHEGEAEFDRIVVPWGAAHLRGVEDMLEAEGWRGGPMSEQVLWRWSALF